MLVFAIFAFIAVVLPVFRVLPLVIKGDKIQNSPYFLKMAPREGIPYYDARLAQEKAEYWLRWVVGVLVALPTVPFLPTGVPIIVAMLGTMLVHPKGPFYKELELIGHTVEVVVAERAGAPSAYIQREARDMKGHYAVFENMSVDQIVAAMNARRWIARPLISLLV